MKTKRKKGDPLREALEALEDGESKIREAIAAIDATIGKAERPAEIPAKPRVLKIGA